MFRAYLKRQCTTRNRREANKAVLKEAALIDIFIIPGKERTGSYVNIALILRFPVPDYYSVLVKLNLEFLFASPFQRTDVPDRDSYCIA